jgi:hypothetical protein
LADGGANPVVVFAGHDDFGYLKGREVADAEVDEFAGFVELVDGREGFGEGGSAILITLERLEKPDCL